MSQPKQKFEYMGKPVEGESVKFETQGEQWSLYTLEDGSNLKIKTVLMDVIKLDEHNPATGDPVYVISAQQVLGVVPNPALKKKVG